MQHFKIASLGYWIKRPARHGHIGPQDINFSRFLHEEIVVWYSARKTFCFCFLEGALNVYFCLLKRYGENESSILWFTPQVSTASKTGSAKTQGSASPSGSPMLSLAWWSQELKSPRRTRGALAHSGSWLNPERNPLGIPLRSKGSFLLIRQLLIVAHYCLLNFPSPKLDPF